METEVSLKLPPYPKELEETAYKRGFAHTFLETNIDWHDAISFYHYHQYIEKARNEFGIRFFKSIRH